MTALVAGALVVVAGLLWRARVHKDREARVAAALADADPAVRADALQLVASVGLRPWATTLLRRAAELDDRAATDPAAELLRAELAWLVAACQWEPADEAGVVQLRLWAKAHHASVETPQPPPRRAVPATPPASTALAPDELRAAAERVLGEPVVEMHSSFRPDA